MLIIRQAIINLGEDIAMKWIGVLFAMMAVVIGVVPHFTNCSAHGRAIELPQGRSIPMRCHWTANAAPVVAAPLLLAGAVLFFGRTHESRFGFSLLGCLLGLSAILLPTRLIGVCSSEEMVCKLAMEPTLIFCGVLTFAGGVIGAVLAAKSGRPRAHVQK